VRVFDADGKPEGEVKLETDPGRKPAPIHDLRVHGTEFIVKRSDPTTLFVVYDRTTGKRLRRVRADVDVLTARFPTAVWTAGRPVSLRGQVRCRTPEDQAELSHLPSPAGRARASRKWPSSMERSRRRPASRGLYQMRVTPDVHGRVADHVLDGFVEIRTPGAAGSVSIFTPLNRYYYGQGEEIPVSILVRAPKYVKRPEAAALRVTGPKGPVLQRRLELKDARTEFRIPAKESLAWTTGRYVIDADIPGFTVAPQYLEIGPGLRTRPVFHITQHGDYATGFSAGPRPFGNLPRLMDAPETVADHLARARRLGLNTCSLTGSATPAMAS